MVLPNFDVVLVMPAATEPSEDKSPSKEWTLSLEEALFAVGCVGSWELDVDPS